MLEPYDPDRPPSDTAWIGGDGEVHTGPIPGMTPEKRAGLDRLFGQAFAQLDIHQAGATRAQLAFLAAAIDRMTVEERFAAALMTEAVRDANDDLFDQMAPANPDWAATMEAVRDVMAPMGSLLREGAVMVLNLTIGALRHAD